MSSTKGSSSDETAVLKSLLLLREVRSRGAGGTSSRASLQLINRLPEYLSQLIEKGATSSRRQLALEKISDVVARVDVSDERTLRKELYEIGLITAVVMCLEAAPIENETLLVPGLILLSNVSLIGDGALLVIQAGGAELLARLLCGLDGRARGGLAGGLALPKPLPSLAVRRYAAAALFGMTREHNGREAVPLVVRAKLMESLSSLAAADTAAYRHANGALVSLRKLRRFGVATGGSSLYKLSSDKAAALAAEDRKRHHDAMERARLAAGLVRYRAACKLQQAFRLKRDARIGAQNLRVQQKALAFIGATWRGRQQRLVAKFGYRLKARAQTTLAARFASASADLPSEEAELLLDMFDNDAEQAAADTPTLSVADVMKLKRKANRARRKANLRLGWINCMRSLICLDDWLFVLDELRWLKRKLSRRDTYLPEAVSFVVTWTLSHNKTAFLRCAILISYASIFLGAIPIMMARRASEPPTVHNASQRLLPIV